MSGGNRFRAMVMLALFLCISPSLSLSYAEVHAVISESGRVRINYTLISKSGGNFSLPESHLSFNSFSNISMRNWSRTLVLNVA